MYNMPPMTEKDVMTVFNAHKRRLLLQLGRKATTNTQLTHTGRLLLGSCFKGAHPQDYQIKKTPKIQYFILNNHKKGQSGEHWVAILKNGNVYYVYDSFGRTSNKLLPHFSKNRIIIDSDYDAEQFGESEICGQLCLAWLLCVKELGIRNALLV